MRTNRLRIVTAGLLLVVTGAAGGAPEADLWPYWEAHDPKSTRAVDHSAWAAFLDAYLVEGDDGINRVRYGDVSNAGRGRLDAYIARLADATVTGMNRDTQFAFWLNLYNALTVQVVLDHYPVDSIRDIDISPGWFSNGPWDKKLVTVEQRKLSLNDIEHRILRPIWRDPRIHYAVNCASLGCPNLMPTPYRAAELQTSLDSQARAYINHPRGADLDDGNLVVSSIYDWYQEDFGGDEAGVVRHLREYAEAELARQLEPAGGIDDYRYDWSLNDAR